MQKTYADLARYMETAKPNEYCKSRKTSASVVDAISKGLDAFERQQSVSGSGEEKESEVEYDFTFEDLDVVDD